DLAVLLEVARILRVDLPHDAAVLDLHAMEVLDALRDLRKEVGTELVQPVPVARADVTRHEVPDPSEGGAHHEEQGGAQPGLSHREIGWSRRELPRGFRTVKANALGRRATTPPLVPPHPLRRVAPDLRLDRRRQARGERAHGVASARPT